MTCTVYEATCSVHGKRYVGQSKDWKARRRSHGHAARAGSKSLFHRAVRKHGLEAFEWEVRAELPTVEEAKIAEMILIALERPEYNMSAGGDGAVGVKHTEERKAQIGAWARQQHHTDETKAKISAAHLGRVISVETRAKQSEAAKKRDWSGHHMRGKSHSAETKAKISATKKANPRPSPTQGKPRSAETKAKISATKRANAAAKLTAQQQVVGENQ